MGTDHHIHRHSQSSDLKKLSLLTLGALGVVYGDIGTSPLYALRECFIEPHPIDITHDHVLGVLSLIFWSLISIVSFKYIFIVLRADNRGEGGILALMALAAQKCGISKRSNLLTITILGIFGAALLYGDGIITPAITVLGAVEGLKIATPVFSNYVVPITAIILIGLFLAQRFGSGKIGFVFGPIMLVWFFTIGVLGLIAIPKQPEVLAAINPWYAIEFLIANGKKGFFILSDVLLVVTGAEALYADMGHFNRRSIRLAWFSVALPGLMLNYLGQGALLLSDPSKVDNPFYLMAPEPLLFPLIILATAAAIIASQALISGVFSLTRQAIQLGFFPRLAIKHTSSDEIGQIYIPFMNWTLLIGTLWLVYEFKSSSALSGAYGVAISTMMVITTLLAAIVSLRIFRWTAWIAIPMFLVLLLIDSSFFLATASKLHDGGWLPLTVALGLFIVMTTWKKGREILASRLAEKNLPISNFLTSVEMNELHRVSGTAVFMTGDPTGTPPALVHNMKHNKVLHERVILMTIKSEEIPYVSMQNRVEIQTLGREIYRVLIHYGFQETPNIRKILKYCEAANLHIKMEETIFFVGRETIVPSDRPGMALWREKLFSWMSKNGTSATSFFRIPSDRVIEVGIQVDI